MNIRSTLLADRFEEARNWLIENGSLPPNAGQITCPADPGDVIARLLRAGADPESLTTAFSEVFRWPVYDEAAHGPATLAQDGSWAFGDGRLFVMDPFASLPLAHNPQLVLSEPQLRQYRGETGLLPIRPAPEEPAGEDPSHSPAAERILHKWIAQAAAQGASDLHITPRDNQSVEIRIRRNGLLTTVSEEPMATSAGCHYRQISNTLLTLSGNQHGVYNVPRDGQMELAHDRHTLSIRVNMCPVLIGRRTWGSFTLRIAGAQRHSVHTLDRLRLERHFTEELRRVSRSTSGLVILTGPTGSGKTTTFYSVILEILQCHRGQLAIKTLEDPIEIQIPGIDQIQINPDFGLDYATGLRALLRADPDVILIGEIRDEETAQLACRASLTGHLVLSTLHTKDSFGAFARLNDLKVPDALIADTVTTISAQRLVRALCPDCAEGAEGAPRSASAQGCVRCHHTGYRDRLCVSEYLRITPELAENIAAGRIGAAHLHTTARSQGFRGLWDHADALIASGHTTREECLRRLPAPQHPCIHPPQEESIP